MKTFGLKIFSVLLISVLIFQNCNKDEEQVSMFIGNYVITEALIAESFTIPVIGLGNVPVLVNTPVTEAIQTALLSAVTCSSPDKSYIELRDDFSLYLTCEGANALNGGTWAEASSTELQLNLNSTAVPTSPSGIALTVTDVNKTGNILTGKTSVPMPKEFIAAIVAPMTLDDSAPSIYVIKISLKFTQK
ncbi:MAG TPA: hypothetical protein VMV47_00640 [Bacteroidales bacterium]|nr:hypothetical protein [Bacteroidales bacterium]